MRAAGNRRLCSAGKDGKPSFFDEVNTLFSGKLNKMSKIKQLPVKFL